MSVPEKWKGVLRDTLATWSLSKTVRLFHRHLVYMHVWDWLIKGCFLQNFFFDTKAWAWIIQSKSDNLGKRFSLQPTKTGQDCDKTVKPSKPYKQMCWILTTLAVKSGEFLIHCTLRGQMCPTASFSTFPTQTAKFTMGFLNGDLCLVGQTLLWHNHHCNGDLQVADSSLGFNQKSTNFCKKMAQISSI